MSTPTQPPVVTDEPPTAPAYTASGRPVTRGERIAFQLWIICTLLTLVGTLLMFLIDKIGG